MPVSVKISTILELIGICPVGDSARTATFFEYLSKFVALKRAANKFE